VGRNFKEMVSQPKYMGKNSQGIKKRGAFLNTPLLNWKNLMGNKELIRSTFNPPKWEPSFLLGKGIGTKGIRRE